MILESGTDRPSLFRRVLSHYRGRDQCSSGQGSSAGSHYKASPTGRMHGEAEGWVQTAKVRRQRCRAPGGGGEKDAVPWHQRERSDPYSRTRTARSPFIDKSPRKKMSILPAEHAPSTYTESKGKRRMAQIHFQTTAGATAAEAVSNQRTSASRQSLCRQPKVTSNRTTVPLAWS